MKEVIPNYTDRILLVLNSTINANSEVMGLLASVLGSGVNNYGDPKAYRKIQVQLKGIVKRQSKAIEEVMNDEPLA